MTGDYVEGILEMHPKKISLNYLKKILIFDLIALISSSLDYSNHEYKWHGSTYRFLILAKIPRFFVYTKTLIKYFKMDQISKFRGYSKVAFI